MRAYGDGLAYQEYVQDVEPYYPKPLTGGTVEDDEDEDDLVVGHDPTERDPALTEEEQDWLNRQLDNVVIDHVNKELAGAADEAPVPELICADGEEPTAEEMDRFIEQVEELEAWHAPMTSIYADEEKPDETKSAAKRSPKTSAEKAAAPESKKPGEAEEARASAAKDDKVAGKVPAAEKGAPSKESGSAAEGG
ncbi:hypothetical protein DIPPA_08862 [Diplonema papillatum]|nr:hypothetical protein DIPPA_08862 [Diplonema papillatum]